MKFRPTLTSIILAGPVIGDRSAPVRKPAPAHQRHRTA
jgi:hypothetical protein